MGHQPLDRVLRALRASLLSTCGLIALSAGEAGARDHLPPELPWDGASRELMLAADHPWATPAERAAFETTPRYDETVAWLRKLVAASPDLNLVSIGTSAEGRDIWMVVATRSEEWDSRTLRASDKPVVLAQAGIHSGEIDGKDAGLMLLRDMTVLGSKKELLDRVHFLFIPILSVDGHERVSRFSRVNQRGPEEAGWRTNARNLNLNRDYMKLETEEVRAVVQVINEWQPDLYIDLHVTDGADYQYDVTWDTTPAYGWSSATSRWISEKMRPAVDGRLIAQGHVPGPFVWPGNGRDLSGGMVVWLGSPRFSNVYGAARHLPSILVENHSLKPYDQRVLGTYVFLESALAVLGSQHASLREAVEQDRAARPETVVLDWGGGEGATVEKLQVKGVRSEVFDSPVTGGEVVRWTGELVEQEVALSYLDVVRIAVDRPEFYYIPAAWSHIADKLRLHGIELEHLDQPTRVPVQMYRVPEAGVAGGGSSFDHRSVFYEGRVRVDPGEMTVEQRELELPSGSFRVSTDQPLGTLLVLLLEPQSPDSLFQWGFFIETLNRTEYIEAYIMEPMARAMLEDDPELAATFQKELAENADLAGDPKARLQWFYERTPYFDPWYRLYPIARSRSVSDR